MYYLPPFENWNILHDKIICKLKRILMAIISLTHHILCYDKKPERT